MSKERSILFSAPMISAILDARKTQTRRIITEAYTSRRKDGVKLVPEVLQQIGVGGACPYGVPGDRLWVRETFWYDMRDPNGCVVYAQNTQKFKYRVDSLGPRVQDADEGLTPDWPAHHKFWKKKPSIFMPRWASRITLEVTEVRMQRVQEISEEDAKAEGMDAAFLDFNTPCNQCGETADGCNCIDNILRNAFHCTWNQLNSERGYSWESNPWVWAVTFKRVS